MASGNQATIRRGGESAFPSHIGAASIQSAFPSWRGRGNCSHCSQSQTQPTRPSPPSPGHDPESSAAAVARPLWESLPISPIGGIAFPNSGFPLRIVATFAATIARWLSVRCRLCRLWEISSAASFWEIGGNSAIALLVLWIPDSPPFCRFASFAPTIPRWDSFMWRLAFGLELAL
jgi:hypothetical protein